MSIRVNTPSLIPAAVAVFIDRACDGIRPRSRREDVRRELTAHAEDIASEFSDSNPEEAARAIIQRLGDCVELNKQLIRANRTSWQKWVAYGFAGIVGAAVLGTVGFLIYYTVIGYRELAADQGAITAKFPEIEQDLVLANAVQFLKPQREGNDAGERLNSIARWRASDNNRTEFGGPTFPENIRAQIREARSKNIDERYGALSKIDVSKVDVSWMKGLDQYTYWSRDRVGPGADYQRTHDLGGFGMSWDFLLWSSYSEVRLIKGIQTKNVLPALKETRELARLLYSNNTMISSGIAIMMLDDESQAYEYVVARGLIRNDMWTPVDRATLTALHKTITTYPGLLSDPAVPEGIMKTLVIHDDWTVGLCATVADRGYFYAAVAPYLASLREYESPVGRTIALQNAVVARGKTVCRNDNLKYPNWSGLNWARIATTSDASWSDEFSEAFRHAAEPLEHVPFLRTAIGFNLSKVIGQSPASLYNDKP